MAVRVAKVKQSHNIPAARPAAETEAVPSLIWPIEHWLQFQADLLRAAESNLVGWIDRRCEGTSAALSSLVRLSTSHDMGEAVAIHSDYLDGVMKRLDRDFQSAADHALAVSRCTSGATQHAAEASTGVAAHGAQWVVSKV